MVTKLTVQGEVAALFEVYNSDQTPTTPEEFVAMADAANARDNYTREELALIFAAFEVVVDELIGNDPIAIDRKRHEVVADSWRNHDRESICLCKGCLAEVRKAKEGE